MKVTQASFIGSSTDLAHCPKPVLPEYAFIGRSNVGKSSLINMLTSSRDLARTSSTPGKTTLINHFLINNEWYLVDLPGLGYAKTSRKTRNVWSGKIASYLLHRKNLLLIFFLVDSRLEPQAIDIDFINWLGRNKLPFNILFTKADKLSANALEKNLQLFKSELLKTWEELPSCMITSSKSGTGRIDILERIEETNKLID